MEMCKLCKCGYIRNVCVLCIVHTSVHNMFMLFVSMQCVHECVHDPEFIMELQEKCDQLKATVSSHPLMYFLSIMYLHNTDSPTQPVHNGNTLNSYPA